jgi:hypothetical protein
MTKASTVWVIEPAAYPEDDYWQDRDIWAQLVVSAPTAAQARLVAERWALRDEIPHVGNETPSPRAGFTDAKLYHVHEAPAGLAEAYATASGGNEVLHVQKPALRRGKEPVV